jgi:hypothetical protein
VRDEECPIGQCTGCWKTGVQVLLSHLSYVALGKSLDLFRTQIPVKKTRVIIPHHNTLVFTKTRVNTVQNRAFDLHLCKRKFCYSSILFCLKNCHCYAPNFISHKPECTLEPVFLSCPSFNLSSSSCLFPAIILNLVLSYLFTVKLFPGLLQQPPHCSPSSLS